MRFPKSFSRYKTTVPTGGIVIGTDAVPNTAAGADSPAPSHAPANTASSATVVGDNCLLGRFSNNAGWPIHRIAVGYNYRGVGVAVALPASLYLWDAETRRWYLSTTANLLNDKVVFFDVVALADGLDTTKPTAGSLAAVLVVTDPPAPDGEHRFGIGADLSLYG